MIASLILHTIAIAAIFFVGHFCGYTMGVKVRNVTDLFATPPEPDSLVCTCTHFKSAHTELKGECQSMYVNYKDTGKDYNCACQGYISDPSKLLKEKKGSLDL